MCTAVITQLLAHACACLRCWCSYESPVSLLVGLLVVHLLLPLLLVDVVSFLELLLRDLLLLDDSLSQVLRVKLAIKVAQLRTLCEIMLHLVHTSVLLGEDAIASGARVSVETLWGGGREMDTHEGRAAAVVRDRVSRFITIKLPRASHSPALFRP